MTRVTSIGLLALAAACGGGDRDVAAIDAGFVPYDAAPRDVMALPIDAGVDGDAAIVPLESSIVSFCADLSESTCDAVMRCGCGGPVDVDTCVTSYRSMCELHVFGPDVRRALADGSIRFDGAAAARMIAAIRDPGVCEQRTIAPWTVRDYYSFGGVLEGTRGAGEDCTRLTDSGWGYVQYFQLDECAAGTCDAGRCVEFSGVGGVCDASHFCADLDLPVEHGWELRSMSLPCERASPTAPSGTCAARRPAGFPCESGRDCESDSCPSGTCAPLGDVGDTCTQPRHCATGYCASAGTCAAGDLPAGSLCGSGRYECASDFCFYSPTGSSTCAPRLCSASSYSDLQWLLPRE